MDGDEAETASDSGWELVPPINLADLKAVEWYFAVVPAKGDPPKAAPEPPPEEPPRKINFREFL